MSCRNKCTCGRKKGDHKDLEVLQYKCNYSAFNGYRYTPSKYSFLKCTRKGCVGCFRTKAKYVDEIYFNSIKAVKK